MRIQAYEISTLRRMEVYLCNSTLGYLTFNSDPDSDILINQPVLSNVSQTVNIHYLFQEERRLNISWVLPQRSRPCCVCAGRTVWLASWIGGISSHGICHDTKYLKDKYIHFFGLNVQLTFRVKSVWMFWGPATWLHNHCCGVQHETCYSDTCSRANHLIFDLSNQNLPCFSVITNFFVLVTAFVIPMFGTQINFHGLNTIV